MDMSFREMSMKKPRFQTPTQLNDDLINEVIVHLPAMSNFRFKCVSKQWFSLNTEALKRKSQTLPMSGIFYVTATGTKHRLSVNYARTEKGGNEDYCVDGTLSFLPKHLNMRIHSSCNGLLLCEGWNRHGHSLWLSDSDQTSRLYVCNPITSNWVEISYDYTKAFHVIMLDFNPTVSVHFNVIRIRSCSSSILQQYDLEVFSSKTRGWQVSHVTNLTLQDCIIRNHATSFFKGIIFCINWRKTNIVGVNMEGNCCRRIELPGESHEKDHSFFSCFGPFGPSGGSLCQSGGFLHYYYKSESEFYVWKLVDYESGSWILKNSFRITGALRKIQDLKLHPDMEDVVLIRMKEKMHSYNMKTAQMIELCSLRSPFSYSLYSPCYLGAFGNKSKK